MSEFNFSFTRLIWFDSIWHDLNMQLTTISWSYTLTLLFFSGLLNFFQNIFAFSVLNLVTPLSYSIANASKRIFVVLMSLIMLKNPVTPLNVIGMTTALLGVTFYNLVSALLGSVLGIWEFNQKAMDCEPFGQWVRWSIEVRGVRSYEWNPQIRLPVF